MGWKRDVLGKGKFTLFFLFVLQQLCHLLLWQKLPYMCLPSLSPALLQKSDKNNLVLGC